MKYLYFLGAILVGTPSGQSGNCFWAILEFELNHTSIKGAVSHKRFIDFPDDPEKGRVLMPHFTVTYDKLLAYGFDENAEILYALDILPLINKGRNNR